VILSEPGGVKECEIRRRLPGMTTDDGNSRERNRGGIPESGPCGIQHTIHASKKTTNQSSSLSQGVISHSSRSPISLRSFAQLEEAVGFPLLELYALHSRPLTQ
jgi:hypothetical protein